MPAALARESEDGAFRHAHGHELRHGVHFHVVDPTLERDHLRTKLFTVLAELLAILPELFPIARSALEQRGALQLRIGGLTDGVPLQRLHPWRKGRGLIRLGVCLAGGPEQQDENQRNPSSSHALSSSHGMNGGSALFASPLSRPTHTMATAATPTSNMKATPGMPGMVSLPARSKASRSVASS